MLIDITVDGFAKAHSDWDRPATVPACLCRIPVVLQQNERNLFDFISSL